MRVELVEELVDASVDLVASRADFIDWSACGVWEVPVDVALFEDVGALVAAAHRHDDVGLLGELAGEQLGPAVGEIDVELAHQLDHLRVDSVSRGGSGGGGGGPAV